MFQRRSFVDRYMIGLVACNHVLRLILGGMVCITLDRHIGDDLLLDDTANYARLRIPFNVISNLERLRHRRHRPSIETYLTPRQTKPPGDHRDSASQALSKFPSTVHLAPWGSQSSPQRSRRRVSPHEMRSVRPSPAAAASVPTASPAESSTASALRRHRNRNGYINIIAGSRKHRMRSRLNDQKQIACRAAMHAGISFTRQPNP